MLILCLGVTEGTINNFSEMSVTFQSGGLVQKGAQQFPAAAAARRWQAPRGSERALAEPPGAVPGPAGVSGATPAATTCLSDHSTRGERSCDTSSRPFNYLLAGVSQRRGVDPGSS